MGTGSGSSPMSGGMRSEEVRRVMLLAVLLLGLAACNTVEGIGSDVSASARAIGDALT